MTANMLVGSPTRSLPSPCGYSSRTARRVGTSYAQLVRRSRRRYPQATVREGTTSEMLNGKRLPRWEMVEPVAWALSGETAVAACWQRWIGSDAARTPAARTPAAPAAARPTRLPCPPRSRPNPCTRPVPRRNASNRSLHPPSWVFS